MLRAVNHLHPHEPNEVCRLYRHNNEPGSMIEFTGNDALQTCRGRVVTLPQRS